MSEYNKYDYPATQAEAARLDELERERELEAREAEEEGPRMTRAQVDTWLATQREANAAQAAANAWAATQRLAFIRQRYAFIAPGIAVRVGNGRKGRAA